MKCDQLSQCAQNIFSTVLTLDEISFAPIPVIPGSFFKCRYCDFLKYTYGRLCI